MTLNAAIGLGVVATFLAIATSAGTRRPASLSAVSAPAAIESDAANSASMSGWRARRARIASAATFGL